MTLSDSPLRRLPHRTVLGRPGELLGGATKSGAVRASSALLGAAACPSGAHRRTFSFSLSGSGYPALPHPALENPSASGSLPHSPSSNSGGKKEGEREPMLPPWPPPSQARPGRGRRRRERAGGRAHPRALARPRPACSPAFSFLVGSRKAQQPRDVCRASRNLC